jgi:hypothetical protein
VNKKGVYSLSDAQISALLGISAGDVQTLIESGQLRLSSGGHPVAYLPAAGNAGIIFYGAAMDSVYTDENVYWIERGEGLRMAHVPGAPPVPAGGELTFTDTVHAEEDLCALTSLFNDPRADYWAWAYVVSGDATTNTRNFTVVAEGAAPAAGTATLTVHLKGGSSSAANPDHHARVSLNGTALGECRWDGTETHDASFLFDGSALRDGANTVTVTGLLDTGAPYSIFYVDSFDLTYRRYYRAAGGLLHLKGEENAVVTVSGFSAPDLQVMDISDPAAPKILEGKTIDGAAGNYRISFAPASPSAPYCAFASGAVGTPAGMAACGDSGLMNAENRADYLIITDETLRDAARELATYRASGGLETMVVTFREIIDEFNNGISAPEAIREFLSYAHQHWSKGPRYVVLAGDGTYDYRNRLGYGDSLVPPLMVGTQAGLFASDTALGDVEGDDGIPEIAVGRLPVITSQELQVIISKIIAYEEAGGGPWMEKALMVADNPDWGGNFTSGSDSIIALLPAGFTVDQIYLSMLSAAEARQLLIGGINSGASILSYFGHAGLDRLAQEALLTTGDIPSLANQERLPLVTAMTCSMGKFAVPGYDCLAEELVLKSDGGAVAVWGSTSLSANSEAKVLAEEFYLGAFGEYGTNVLGELALGAAEGYGAAGGSRSMIAMYNIIGDPALKLQLGESSASSTDTDGDGLSNDEEARYGTNSTKADTDGDGFSDLIEILSGSNPLDDTSTPDSLRVNFQPAGAAPPPNFDVNSGEHLVRGRAHGWR